MIVYQSTKQGFRDDVFSNEIDKKILEAYKIHLGRSTSANETLSWKNSMSYMDRIMEDPDIPADAGISIEFQIPLTSKRIDFIITGLNEVQQEQVVIIELKQWSSAELTDKDALVKTRFQHGISETAHPSYQAWSYATLIKDYNQTVREEQITLTPCAYLHNYPKDQIITNPRYKPYITEAPPFFQSDAGKLREFIKKYVKYGDSKDILYKIENGRLRPSKQLADNLVSMLKGNQEFIMLDDQKVVYETALSMIRKASADKKQVLIIKGGPGTGKTTTINAMIHFFEEEGADILLAAPTGRAAKRMTEATGCEAQTIHRLLEVSGNPEDDDKRDKVGFGNGFGRNAENPLESDVIIIDEMSMVDLPLMKALLDAIMPGTRLIMVGDGNQLPSVGPGRVLKDMIASDCFPVVKLEKIFRQAKESDIIVNAHKINRGEPVILDNKSMDFFFLKRSDPNVIISVVITLIQKKLPKFVDASPYDIQVLTPMRKGNLGVERLNKILQQYLNPPSPQKQEKEVGDRLLREGDKVMQIKNNYQLEWEVCTKYGMTIDKGLGVFNGDMGIIKNINTYEETVTVEYDEQRQVKYPYAILDELELAYAITIHKAQGSEYPAVVIPLLQGPRQLYNRNLIYTAVTRARKCVTLVGSDSVFQEMIQNTSEQRRNTSLAERIRELA